MIKEGHTMELVLTEVGTGGYRAHRPNCKKIVEKEQFDPEELSSENLSIAKPCSSCKPKPEDFEAMLQTTPAAAAHPGEPADISEDDEWDDLDEDLIGDVDADGLDPETVESVGEDGLEPEAETAPTASPAAPPKKPKPAKAKEPELKAEQAEELVEKVAAHLGLAIPDLKFPGFGKAIKTADKQTVYLNSKGTADVRANSPEQAATWVEEGLAERRGGNYVRVAVRDL